MAEQLSLRDELSFKLVGEALQHPERLGEYASLLKPSDLPEKSAQRRVYESMLALHFEGAPVDETTIRTRCRDIADIEGLTDILKRLPCSDFKFYAEKLREENLLSKLQISGLRLSGAAELSEAREILTELNSFSAEETRAEVTEAGQAAQEFFERLTAVKKPDYLRLGMEELDSKLYLELGDFIVLGGYPKAGKTLLGIQMSRRLAEKYRVGYFFLESSKEKLMDRVMSSMSRVPMSRIKSRDLSDAEIKSLTDAAKSFSGLSFEIINAAGMSVGDIEAIALNRRYQVIVIDYMQLVTAPGKGLYEQVTSVSKSLHTMGRRHGIAVLALAQLSRPEKSKGKPAPPNLSSFRESGQIEQDADAAMLLFPSDPNDNRSTRILNLAKNKEGEAVRLELEFDGAIQTMKPVQKSSYRRMQEGLAEQRREQKAEQMRQTSFKDISDSKEPLPF